MESKGGGTADLKQQTNNGKQEFTAFPCYRSFCNSFLCAALTFCEFTVTVKVSVRPVLMDFPLKIQIRCHVSARTKENRGIRVKV